jgi:RNA ligase
MDNLLYTLEQYSRTGLLFKQTHPTLDLTIWNYSPAVQYGNLWDEITLKCRGLVTNNEGNIIARPFKKFFNIEEGKHTPTEDFEVYEKMDGSMGILFNYKGEWILSTRGSFISEQSIKGRELLEKYNYSKLHPDYTYIFEIIYFENRIVCQYDFEDLILLGMIHTKTGYDVDIHSGSNNDIRLKNILNNIGINIVKKYDGIKDYNTLKQMVDNNAEGFVVKFSNGDRMKIKGEEYLRLHKIMTNISTTGIWEYISNGGDIIDTLKDVPDEFYEKIKSYEKTLRYGYYQVSEYCGKSYDSFRYGKYGDKEVEPTKKEFAEYVMKNCHPPYRSVMFAMWDGKPYDKLIWNIIKPEFKKL